MARSSIAVAPLVGPFSTEEPLASRHSRKTGAAAFHPGAFFLGPKSPWLRYPWWLALLLVAYLWWSFIIGTIYFALGGPEI